MTTKQARSRASERPSSTIRKVSGKCPLLTGIRRRDDERAICLNCPYERCFHDEFRRYNECNETR